MMRSSSGGIAGLAVETGSGSRFRIASKMTAEVLPRKGSAAGRHFVQHHAEREEVGARVDLLAARLLRRHIGDGADSGSRAGV